MHQKLELFNKFRQKKTLKFALNLTIAFVSVNRHEAMLERLDNFDKIIKIHLSEKYSLKQWLK